MKLRKSDRLFCHTLVNFGQIFWHIVRYLYKSFSWKLAQVCNFQKDIVMVLQEFFAYHLTLWRFNYCQAVVSIWGSEIAKVFQTWLLNYKFNQSPNIIIGLLWYLFFRCESLSKNLHILIIHKIIMPFMN